MKKENLIPIDKLEGDFNYFLRNIEDNKRIFFSGRFGIGKTYFLREFFLSHIDEYEVFHLFPVNYQINKNEDIIDLIKYDILVELFIKNSKIFDNNKVNGVADSAKLFISFLKEKKSINDFLQSLVDKSTYLSSLSPDPLMQTLRKLGRPLKDLLELDKEFQLFKEDFKTGEEDAVNKFLNEVNKKGINETDYISHLIKDKILKQKEEKKSVLILDDIDRVEPDHVFRILNILSAHFDDQENKFNFDHIIIVGDIKNIQSVFYHKYGEKTDFWGYFDKFFTVRPYFLENKGIIKEHIPNLMKQIKYEEKGLKSAIGEGGYIKLLFSDILTRALNIGRLNLRQLYKPVRHNFPEFKNGVFSNDAFHDNFQKIMDIGIKTLIAIFGDLDFFISVLKEIKEDINDEDDGRSAPYEAYIASLIKTIMSLPDKPEGTKQTWGNYFFILPLGQEKQIQIDGPGATKTRFFYDALIEYVVQLKHIKSNDWEYDR